MNQIYFLIPHLLFHLLRIHLHSYLLIMHNKSFLRTIFDRPIENLKIGNTVKTLQNKESLMLYRDILKFSNEFYWKN